MIVGYSCKRLSSLALEVLFKPRTFCTSSSKLSSEGDTYNTDASLAYTERERSFREDDATDPNHHIRHRKTYTAKQYKTTVAELEKSALREELDPSGERYISRLTVSIKGSSYATIRSYVMFAKYAATCLDIKTSLEPGKLVTGVYTVNRSPFVHGKHMDRFKKDIWCRKVILHDVSGTTADVYLSYIQRNIPHGITMAVTEERLVAINNEFISAFYNETNDKLLQELPEAEADFVRSIVPPAS